MRVAPPNYAAGTRSAAGTTAGMTGASVPPLSPDVTHHVLVAVGDTLDPFGMY
jgi:hypothetical protein